MRLTQQKTGAPIMYDRHCLKAYTKEKRHELAQKEGSQYTIRLKVPDGTTVFNDRVYGPISYQNSSIDDQVLVKSDQFPTYHFANVIDDHLMKISHVLRGQV